MMPLLILHETVATFHAASRVAVCFSDTILHASSQAKVWRACGRFFLHWLVINIPGLDVKRGEVITPYMGPAPPKGRHRYVFLLYKQSGRLSAKNPHSRQNFTVHQFAQV
jgi:phosphatidylethanolamine-binding protein (PEBP) family uncharacterized protein